MKKKIGVDFFSEVFMPSWIEKRGDTIYFVGTKANLEKNNYEKDIYQLKNGKVRQLTRFNDVSSYQCLDSGLRFVKSIKGKETYCVTSAIYELAYDGGEAMKVFELPYVITNVKWIDDNRFFFTASENLKYNRLVASGMTNKEASQKMDKDNNECREFVEVPFWTNGGGDISENRNVLYVYDNGNVERLSEYDGNVRIATLSKDHKTIYYTKENITNGLADTFNRLYSYDLEAKRTSEHLLFEKDIYYRSMYFKNDTEALVGVCLAEKYGDEENTQLFMWNTKTQALNKVYDGEPYSLGNSVGSDIKMGNRSSQPIFKDDGFYMIVTDEHHAPLMKFSYQKMTQPVTQGLEMVQEVIEDENGYLIIAMVDNHANEIYHLDEDGTLQKLTSFNDHLENEYQYHDAKTVTFKNENGVVITGWVMLPELQKGEKCPAIFDIHGGPKATYGPHFFHEMQWFCANGYAVMFTNPTGSDGRGNEFSDIRGKYGTVDYRDLMTFVDTVLDTYPCIDKERLGVTGGSYGGFMTNWIIGHTHRFKAAVSQRSIASWLIFENTSDIGYSFGQDQMQGDQWHNLELLWNQSPIQFVPNVTTPTLFIHSDEDTRCWMAEGISMFTALKRHGVESKLCLFKQENHELSRSGRPQNRVRRLEELLGWMDRYLK